MTVVSVPIVYDSEQVKNKKLQRNRSISWKRVYQNKWLYFLVLPALVYYAVFAYYPMYGITLAFKQYMFSKGIVGSPWVGLANFKQLFQDPTFWSAFRNTLSISLGRLAFEFPVSIILALLLNELTRKKFKKFYQTMLTFPHFLSWVVMSGIFLEVFGDTGIVNGILAHVGIAKIDPFVTPSLFRPLLFITDNLKEMGWGTIIYLAAMTGVSPELYEASYVDGAGRWSQMWHVTLPGIRGTIAVLLILAVGGLMNGGFDQIFNMYSGPVQPVGDILQTYVYRLTFLTGGSWGVTTAAGLFGSAIGAILLVITNFVVKRMGQEGLF